MKWSEIVERAESIVLDVDLVAARKWREEHGGAKAIASLPIYFPRELIHAAGMLPIGLMGAGGQIEIIRGDAYFQSYICQIPRSTIEVALLGKYDFIDGFLFPSICDVIRNLSGMWKILFPTKYVRYFDVPQNYAKDVGGRFYARELSDLAEDLGRLAGRPITPDRLRDSIRVYNDNRAALRSLFDLRNRQPWRVPCHEAYVIARCGQTLPPETHTKLVRDYLAAVEVADRPMRDNSRIVTVGSFCEQPPIELLKTLEMAGCDIVWDDCLLGMCWFHRDVPTEGDPLVNLAEAFLTQSASTASRYEPDDEKGAWLVRKIGEVKAEGVIFSAASFCDPALLEQPMLQDALDKRSIPWTAFKYAENLGQFQVIREQAGTFADSVKLWSDK